MCLVSGGVDASLPVAEVANQDVAAKTSLSLGAILVSCIGFRDLGVAGFFRRLFLDWACFADMGTLR